MEFSNNQTTELEMSLHIFDFEPLLELLETKSQKMISQLHGIKSYLRI